MTNENLYVAPEKKTNDCVVGSASNAQDVTAYMMFNTLNHFFFINSDPNIKYTHNIIGLWVISRVMVKIIKVLIV